MKSSILVLAAGLLLGGLLEASEPVDFPTTRVTHYENLVDYVTAAPFTEATFAMERTLPSGRVLHSKGTFQYRQGKGILWRTEKPVLTSMVVTAESLEVFNAKGKRIRYIALGDSPTARYMTAVFHELSPDLLANFSRAFHLSCATQGRSLQLGMRSRHSASDLRWMLVRVENGNVVSTEFESGRQGRVCIRFSDIKHARQVPDTDFPIVK